MRTRKHPVDFRILSYVCPNFAGSLFSTMFSKVLKVLTMTKATGNMINKFTCFMSKDTIPSFATIIRLEFRNNTIRVS